MFYRRFYGQASQDSLKQLYLSLVRPHLEYASQVWDPHLAKDRNALEKVQKIMCKLATSKWNSSYEELLDLTDLKPLQDRRLESKLGLLFKLVHNLYNDAVTALLSNRFQFATVWGKKEAI